MGMHNECCKGHHHGHHHMNEGCCQGKKKNTEPGFETGDMMAD